ncbi:MAG TPA: CARDB domain-containing protein, partial [Chitinophagaceae bacterium]
GSVVDFSAPGAYPLKVVVVNDSPDANTANDTMSIVIKHLSNQPLNLSTAFKDDLEGLPDITYDNKTIGLIGSDRYDFENSTTLGRLRSFINSGISFSGTKALSLDIKAQSAASNINHLVGTFNLSNYNANNNELRLDFQFNFHGPNRPEDNKVWIRGNDTEPWIFMYDLFANKAERGTYKLTSSIELSDSLIKYGQNFSSSFQIRWTQNGSFPAVDKKSAAGVSFDDIRIYEVVSDAQLLSIDAPVGYNCNLTNTVPVKITIRNGTNTDLTQVTVKYSINGGAWTSETIPTINGESTIQYSFSKAADFSKPGKYIIKSVVDYGNDSFRSNDTITSVIQSLPYITAFPYLQNFEENDGGWFSAGSPNSWQYGTPASAKIKTAASGTKAWKTNLSGDYNNEEFSFLYSPCFNIAGMTKPTVSFSAAFDLEDCGATQCDKAWIEYSLDGSDWLRLIDTANEATNWYNKTTIAQWSIENYTRWHVVTASLPTGVNSLRLRFVLQTDPGATREGIAIDDVHVYDNIQGIYVGTDVSPVVQNIPGGNGWINFSRDGKLIASILPNNQNLGATAVQAYIFTDSVRNNGSQYYHNRSITIKPAQTSLNDSTIIRFYFLDGETEALLNATGCTGCTKPSSAYELGISQYDDYDSNFENGSIHDNQQGLWAFISPDKVTKVPFDKGYYAEFKVKNFSEFWLNNGAIDKSTTLPVKLLSFSAQKTAGLDAMLSWNVGT